jgi:ethanolamine utilization protein EutQ (cupin superfamily)
MITLEVDEKELRQIQKDLDKLLPFDRGTKTIVRQAMRKALKPSVKKLKGYLKEHRDSGDLYKSIGLFNVKTAKSKAPIVGVGPRKTSTGKQNSKLPTGYMYYIEYGKDGKAGERYLDKTLKETGQQVASLIVPSLRSIIDRRFKKKRL